MSDRPIIGSRPLFPLYARRLGTSKSSFGLDDISFSAKSSSFRKPKSSCGSVSSSSVPSSSYLGGGKYGPVTDGSVLTDFQYSIPLWTRAIAFLLFSIIIFYTVIACFGELFLIQMDEYEWCESFKQEIELEGKSSRDGSSPSSFIDVPDISSKVYGNPDYITDPCRYERITYLFGLTVEECDMARRLLASVFFGAAIGYERRAVDRPAGIRLMCLVSLGAAIFSLSSIMAFKVSSMGWDSSRVSAAVPSGVGFIGAGLIWKGQTGEGGDERKETVHGLTTATSLWISAAIGIAAGGGLYFTAAYSTALVIMILRHGPKVVYQEYDSDDDEDDDDEDDDDDDEDGDEDDDSQEEDNESSGHDSSSFVGLKTQHPSKSSSEMRNFLRSPLVDG